MGEWIVRENRSRPGENRDETFGGRAARGDILVTKLMRDGVEVGLANYFTKERIFAWTIPGMSEGQINNDHLKTQYAGWPFTPDMVWMNLQTIGLYHWKTAINQKGFVARCEPSTPNPLVQFFMPTLSANEPGCDGLHWLDGTVLRYCCDVHDYCYESSGCSWRSWCDWSSWRCNYCNMSSVRCFTTGDQPGVLRPIPEGNTMLRWTSLVLGAATFLAAHAVERAMWTSWFSAEWKPFFMNSGRAVAFTAACVLIAGLVAALLARDRRDALIHAGNVAAGAAAVMIHIVFGRARHVVSDCDRLRYRHPDRQQLSGSPGDVPIQAGGWKERCPRPDTRVMHWSIVGCCCQRRGPHP